MRKNIIPWIVSRLAAIISILFLPAGCLKEEVPYLTLSVEGETEGGSSVSHSQCGRGD